MSNHLAVAAATATLVRVLQDAATKAVPGSLAAAARPGTGEGGPPAKGIGIFLYHVAPNAAWRNRDLPTRGDGTPLMNRPRVALDLHYLFSFYGSEADLEPQRLLGSTVRAMHTRPVLTRDMIRATVAADANLVESDLADQEELVSFSALPLSLDELSKLWSVFFQTPYALSVAFAASVVLIDAEELPRTPRPVRQGVLRVVPFDQPFIEEAVNADGNRDPLRVGDVLVLRGTQLGGAGVGVRIGDSPVLLAPDAASDREVRLTLTASPPAPARPLRAGVQLIQVVRQVDWGVPTQPDLRNAFESNSVPVMIRPVLEKAAGQWATITNGVDAEGTPTRDLAVTVAPPVRDGQRAFVLLNEVGGSGAYTIPVTAGQSGATVHATLAGVPPGNYLLRVAVDRAESLLDLDPQSASFGPRITIP